MISSKENSLALIAADVSLKYGDQTWWSQASIAVIARKHLIGFH